MTTVTRRLRLTVGVLAITLAARSVLAWGGDGHRAVARLALGGLDGALKKRFQPLSARIINSVMDPDERVGVDPQERFRHFCDLEDLGLPFPDLTQPRPTPDTGEKARKAVLDRLNRLSQGQPRLGVLPLAVAESHQRLTEALRDKRDDDVVRATVDLLHYLADAHQPLHATRWHDGVSGGQHGVHAAFETTLVQRCQDAQPRKPEPRAGPGLAPQDEAVAALLESHGLAATVLAEDLGCKDMVGGAGPVCLGSLPRSRARAELACDPLADLARRRLEAAAARALLLLRKAGKDAGIR